MSILVYLWLYGLSDSKCTDERKGRNVLAVCWWSYDLQVMLWRLSMRLHLLLFFIPLWFTNLLSIHFKQLVTVCFLAVTQHNLFPQKQTSVTLLLDPWQKAKQTFWGFNLSSCCQYAVGVGWGLKWKLIQCEMGLEANPLDLSKRKTYHTQRKKLMSPESAGETHVDMLLPQVAVDST